MGPEDGSDKLERSKGQCAAALSDVSANLDVLKRDLAAIKSNIATKADLLEAKNSIVMWTFTALLLSQQLPRLLALLGL